MSQIPGGSVQLTGEGIGTLINPITVFGDGESTKLPAASMQRKVGA